jgi:single-stranded DNA-binding protein
MVYVEGDATMATYQDAQGANRSALNIVQRKCPRLRVCLKTVMKCQRLKTSQAALRSSSAPLPLSPSKHTQRLG